MNKQVKISACILTRNESDLIKETVNHIYDYVDEILVSDASDNNNSIDKLYDLQMSKGCKIPIIIYKKNGISNNFSELRNEIQNYSSGDYVLHIDTDERFNTVFLKNMKAIVYKFLDKNIIPLLFRFPRIGDQNIDIHKEDYQIRFLNRKYTKWIRAVHEIPIVIHNKTYNIFDKEMTINNLITLDQYSMKHLDKDRTEMQKRWNVMEVRDESFKTKNLLVCSMFKNSSLWLDDFFESIENMYYYNDISDNLLKIRFAFLDSDNVDYTTKILNTYRISSSILNIWYKKYNITNTENNRFEKLATLRNYLLSESIKGIYENKLNDEDLILFIDSDIKFEKDVVHKLIEYMKVCKADIIAPMIYIDNYKDKLNSYFYDTLAFRDIDGNKFEHYSPYLSKYIDHNINVHDNKRKYEKFKQDSKLIELKKISQSLNNRTKKGKIETEFRYKDIGEYVNLNTPIEVSSVGSFYLMKYKVLKNTKYSGNSDSEQVEFCNNARANGYKIFVSPKLSVLHVNLEKYGMTWH
jgi:GT2 family glycosyltransferase